MHQNVGVIKMIKGFVPTSLVDWEGKVVSVIFVPGCNFKCGFCSNKDLVLNPEKLTTIKFEEIKDYLLKNNEFVDGVVISGGEPTIYQGIIELCEEIRKLGFKVKMDTNGSNPEVLKKLLEKNLVDYVAMDIKTEFGKYREVVNANIDTEKIKQSIFLVSKFPEYEFRITIFPGVEEEDLIKIAEYLKENKANKGFFMHQFRPDACIDKEFEKKKPYSKEKIMEFYERIKNFFEKSGVRNL